MALATRLAYGLLGRDVPAPDHRPEQARERVA
jgi:hypothetical protein